MTNAQMVALAVIDASETAEIYLDTVLHGEVWFEKDDGRWEWSSEWGAEGSADSLVEVIELWMAYTNGGNNATRA